VDRDFYLELVIDNTQTEIISTVTPSICWYHHGLTVSGPSQEIRVNWTDHFIILSTSYWNFSTTKKWGQLGCVTPSLPSKRLSWVWQVLKQTNASDSL